MFALSILVEPTTVEQPALPPTARAPKHLEPAPVESRTPLPAFPPRQPAVAPVAPSGNYAIDAAALLESPAAGVGFPADVEDDIRHRLNRLRTERDLTGLRHRGGLQEAARLHSLRMQRDSFFAYDDPDGKGAADRVAVVDRTGLYRRIGENLGRIAPILAGVARDMHDGWVNSPSHFANMIQSEYTHVGVGCVQDGKETFCAQVFGTLAGTLGGPVPLVLRRGNTVRLDPKVTPFEFGGWRLEDANETEQGQGTSEILQPPSGLRGTFRLSILGVERKSATRRLIYTFLGPTIVLE
jgi:uncharacterized protein YkwD